MTDTAPSAPRVVVFAGPNGAGKSTHADAILAAPSEEDSSHLDAASAEAPQAFLDGLLDLVEDGPLAFNL